MKIKALITFFLLLNVAFAISQTHTVTDAQQKLIAESLKSFPVETQVSFAFIENGVVTFYGLKQEKDSMVPVSNYRNNFEIGSITKVFTSTLLADFVLEGKVKLDDPINDYIGIPLRDSIRISFKQLANHTSGLPRMPSNFAVTAMLSTNNPFKNYDAGKLKKYLADELRLDSEPGRNSVYSNLGAGLLGYVLCEIADQDYETLLQRYIFSKYSMINSTTLRDKIAQQLVKGLNAKGEETPNWDLSVLIAAGGILSTVEDLSKFALAQFDPTNKELELTRVKTWMNPAGLDIGLGWHFVKSKIGAEWPWHNGGTGGYTSSMAMDIGRRNAIILLTNISSYHSNSKRIDELCFALMKTLKQ
ncbi:MAG: serine hydrolase domain-containing protein [Bacteroidales bacterium]|jgi:CubicO group peptidase (beta-lactamase class C family)